MTKTISSILLVVFTVGCENQLLVDTSNNGAQLAEGESTGEPEETASVASAAAASQSVPSALSSAGVETLTESVDTAEDAVARTEAATAADGGPAASEPEQTICPFGDGLEFDPNSAYPFCQNRTVDAPPLNFDNWVEGDPAPTGSYPWDTCPKHEGGQGAYIWNAAGPVGTLCYDQEDCNACICAVPCHEDTPSGCPAPDSGNAEPACFAVDPGTPGSGSCVLHCDNGEMCPEGMTCVGMAEYDHRVCAWLTAGDRCNEEQLSSQ
jgi:hypothetical protein